MGMSPGGFARTDGTCSSGHFKDDRGRPGGNWKALTSLKAEARSAAAKVASSSTTARLNMYIVRCVARARVGVERAHYAKGRAYEGWPDSSNALRPLHVINCFV